MGLLTKNESFWVGGWEEEALMVEINFYAYKVNVKKQGKSASRAERRSLHP